MRTTLTLDDDLDRALREQAHRTGKSYKQVVNEAIRAGLRGGAGAKAGKRYRLRPASLGGLLPGFNPDKILAISDAIEDQEIARKLELRK